jgi:hypothetical protein
MFYYKSGALVRKCISANPGLKTPHFGLSTSANPFFQQTYVDPDITYTS